MILLNLKRRETFEYLTYLRYAHIYSAEMGMD